MKLRELLAHYARRAPNGVPDWMLGFWKRYSISFANGQTDLLTHVCWLQSRNFTIDLRLPIEAQQAPDKMLEEYSAEELQTLANYEGWTALSDWDGKALSWRDTDVSLQLHNRWPEPALLKRVGNCMIEFAPSDAYVEDWRLQPSGPGPLIGLRLIEERNLNTGALRHKGGGLIVCGDYAALVLGRPHSVIAAADKPLKTLVAEARGNLERLQALFAFETSVARGSLDMGYTTVLSTQPARIGERLFSMSGFEYLPDTQQVRQRFEADGVPCERLFEIDTLEASIDFEQATPCTPESEAWYEKESPTLARYAHALS